MSDKRALPRGWTWTTLGEACDILLGQSPPSNAYNNQGVGLPFYQGKAEFGALYPGPARWCSAPVKVAEPDDVLISVRAPVGPTNLCREKSCIGRGLAAVRPRAGMPSRYFLYFLRCVEQAWANQSTGTTFSAISGRVLRERRVPLAPLDEQLRIVAAIEGYLSQLDTGVAALKEAQAKLKLYEAAVLQALCQGRDYAPADGPNLPKLPQDWCWTTLGQVLERIEAGRSPRAQARPAGPGEFGVLKVSAIGWRAFIPGENKALLPGDAPGETPVVRAGDLLISRANTVDRVGAVALVEQDYPYLMLSDKTLRLLPVSEGVLRSYLLWALRTPRVRNYFARAATGSSDSMRNLSQAKLRALPIPLPPLAEQRRIIEALERRLSAVAALNETLAVNLNREARLRQEIFERAFAGRLLSQNPTDEPATVLLERVACL